MRTEHAEKTNRARLRFLAMAPLVVLAHIVEEWPNLVTWLNLRVEPDLTNADFVAINVIAVLITVLVTVATSRSRTALPALAFVAWLGFVMLANGVLHVAASLVFQEYVPGTVTAGLLYLPYFAFATVTICRRSGVRPRAAVAATIVGAVPMVVQGVGILALGRRILW